MSPRVLRHLSDENLGRRLAAGEAAAFDELYRRYVHRLAAYGAQMLGDAASGDDVAQATLLKAYSSLRSGRVPNTVRPWLYRIAHNCAVDTVARRHELPLEVPDRPTPDDGGTAGDLVAALVALPDRQRQVFLLREIHGLRIDETAAELDLAPAQVEQALFAARNRLAEQLVFGERLSCVAVRRLATGPLDAAERRALKTHLRSCPACRTAVDGSAGLHGMLPVAIGDWLRTLPGVLVGGAAPAAVKVGAVVAGATIATGAPIAYEISKGAGSSHASGPPLVDASSRPAPHHAVRQVTPTHRAAGSATRGPVPAVSDVTRLARWHVAASVRRVTSTRPATSSAARPARTSERGTGDDSADGGGSSTSAVVAAPVPASKAGGTDRYGDTAAPQHDAAQPRGSPDGGATASTDGGSGDTSGGAGSADGEGSGSGGGSGSGD